MTDTQITFGKVITGAATGLIGAGAGGVFAKIAIYEFSGSAVWELPSIIIGALAAFVVAVLLFPTFQRRRRAKHATSETR